MIASGACAGTTNGLSPSLSERRKCISMVWLGLGFGLGLGLGLGLGFGFGFGLGLGLG